MSAVETPPDVGCPRCGAAVRPDQDWCLMCGAAVTTKVAGAPGWRTPVAIVGVVLAIAAAGLVFAFLEISNDADKAAQATPTPTAAAQVTTTPTPVPTAASPTPTPSPGTTATATASPTTSASPTTTASPTATASPATSTGVAQWPAGRSGWTVVYASTTSKADAEKRAKDFQAAGQNVGVLESSQYSSLRRGFWVVFSGVYDTQEEAQKAAEGAQGAAPGAYAREVVPK